MKKNNYFDLLIELGDQASKAASMLNRIYSEFNYNDMKYLMMEMHSIEHSADSTVHNLNKNLINQYMLPFKKEDIFAIGEAVDSIIDSVETLTQCFYTFAIKEMRTDVKNFIEIISESISVINEMLKKLKSHKNFKSLKEYIEKLEYLEDKADKIYIETTKNLFKEENDPIALMQWEEIIHQMEKCTDKCKHTGIVVSKAFFKSI
ncbi:DUF47 domain-containing protein [Peptoniphilus sp. oral taxon 386]|uniref:DUF47 domain-containing protein n=1 Tax=Peptoniphilus sp. oral taxon 386 TaxID=652713 RepID=UPI0003123164|nr:DUF47 family protein [Peptoniphilus sp. oral taxon 386]